MVSSKVTGMNCGQLFSGLPAILIGYASWFRFLFCSPSRAGMLHADPHPGNFRVMEDGRLGVLDFGAVNHLPDGYPAAFGTLTRIFNQGDMDAVVRGLREEGFIRPHIEVDVDALRSFLAPYVEPTRVEEFTFSRQWLRERTATIADLRPNNVVRQLNLPASYVLIHRVHAAGVGVLCQLGTTARFREEVVRWVPGFAGDPEAPLDDATGGFRHTA